MVIGRERRWCGGRRKHFRPQVVESMSGEDCHVLQVNTCKREICLPFAQANVVPLPSLFLREFTRAVYMESSPYIC